MIKKNTQHGFSMIEIMVTLIILMVGLLGLAGLMMQSQRSEMESYQRVQAMILLQDMAARINANRKVASCYAFTTATNGSGPYLGTSATATPSTCTSGTSNQNTTVANDLADWEDMLLGAAETQGGANIGAMIGARGCISYDSASELVDNVTGATIANTGIYTVAIAWQGLGPTLAATPLCGQNQYGSETKRRVVSLAFRTASLL